MPDTIFQVLDTTPRTLHPDTDGQLDGLAPLAQERHSLTDRVYEALRGAIVARGLRPGTVVSEAALADRLGVSKTPVREALLRLQSIGLVEPDGSRGLRVVLPSLEAIGEAYDVRAVLEQGLARRAATVATPEERAEISDLAARSLHCAEDGDVAQGFKSADRAFHRAVGAAAHSSRLARMGEDAAVLANVLRERDVPDVQDAIQCGGQHVEIAEAIGRSDPDAAARGAEAHVNAVRDMVVAAFADGLVR